MSAAALQSALCSLQTICSVDEAHVLEERQNLAYDYNMAGLLEQGRPWV